MIRLLPLFITSIVFSQIGINNPEPKASLDIITSSEKTPLKIYDKDSNLKFQVDSNANLFISNALLVNEINKQNSGKPGQVLTSNGPNKAPSWVDIENSVIGDYISPVLSANNTVASPNDASKEPNIKYPINFLLDNVIFISGYATPSLDTTIEPGASTGTNILTIEKSGVYSITFNGFLVTQNTSGDFHCILNIGDYENYFKGDVNNNGIQIETSMSKFLNVGDKIYITLEGPSSWGFKNLNFLLSYVKADN